MLDPIIHQPLRTQIISLLIKNELMSFKMFKDSLNVTDGNLSTHIKKLVDAEYVHEEKFFEEKKPKTIYKMTPHGLQQFQLYIKQLKKLIDEN